MYNKKLKLMVLDKDMYTTIIEVNQYQFKNLGIDTTNVIKHDSKRELNKYITEFIESFKGDKSGKNDI